MNLLSLFNRNRSAPVARDRLQVLLAHERAFGGRADLAQVLEREILEVIARHIPIDRDKVRVELERGDHVSTLAIDIEMPEAAVARGSPAPGHPRERVQSDGR